MENLVTDLHHYNELIESGLSIIPVKNKFPTTNWKEFQSRLPRLGELSYNGEIGLICGAVSGSVEAVDVDVKNDPSGTLIARLTEAIFKNSPDITEEDLLIQSTPSGGCHMIYKCEHIEGNQILAKGDDRKVLIETRGIGGYVCIDPTPGYETKIGSFKAIPTITKEQRENLFTACRSLNEYFEPVLIPKQHTQSNAGLTPWQDYNERGDVAALLQSHGWTFLRTIKDNQHFCRPDKKGSTSGTWNGKFFYCFTSSTILEPSKAYSASALFAFLECNKDFTEAGRRLYSLGYGERSQSKPTNNHTQKIKPNTGCNLFRLTKPTSMERPKKIAGSLWAQGELCFLFAEDGAGKSIFAKQLGDAIATGKSIPGFQTEIEAQPVTLFDTELSDYQFNNRYPEGLPSNLKRYTFDEESQAMLINADVSFVVGQIELAAEAQGSKIIILDNLSALTSMLDLTKTSDSIQIMGLLNDLKRKGFSIMVIDHTRKPMHEGEFKTISKHDLQGSKMKSNLADSVFSLGKSCQGENIRYVKALKIRSYEMSFTKNGVASMELRTSPLRLDFLSIDPEYQHVNDRNSEIVKGASSGLSQRQIAEKFNISQQAVSKKLRNV